MLLTATTRRAICAILATLLCAMGAAASAHGATQIAAGNDPDSVVDRDGVTHIVWNESRPGESDVTHYCQIPQGGSACTNAESFIPTASDPSLNTDFEGPRVVISPFGEVAVVTNRCCSTIMGRPSQPSVNVMYLSTDGGLTFDGGAPIGAIPPGEPSVPTPAVFDGAGRQILTMNAPTGGVHVQAQPLAPYGGGAQPFTPGTSNAQLSNYDSYDPSIVQTSPTSFVAAWSNLGGTASYFRTLTCPASPCAAAYINTAANWTPQVGIPDAELPRLTSGPNGTFLMYRGTAGDSDNKYFLRKIDGTAAGAALPVSAGNGGNFRDVLEDPNGLLHAVYVGADASLSYRASANGGVSWGDTQTLAPGPDFTLSKPRIAARTIDDTVFQGSAIWVSNDGGTRNPPILFAALPDPSVSLAVKPPPGTGGGGGGAGGGTTTPPAPIPPGACQTLSFAAVDVIADACFRREGSAYVATGGVKINGLRIELGSGKLKLDPKARTITSSGAKVTVKVGDTVLYKDDIDWTLPKASTASLGSIDVSGGGDLLGFPLEGKAELKLRGGGAEIPVHLGLPALFGGVTGDVTIRADNVAGVHLRELHVKVGDALIGPLEIKDLFFDYDADTVSWAGGATVILPPQPPGPSLEGKIGFSHGSLDYLRNELTLPGPGIVLDPFGATYLKKIRFSLKTNPLQLSGGVTINAGPTVGGVALIGVDGDLTFTLGDPAILRADGRVSLASIPLGNAYFELRTNGYVALGGHLGYELSGFSATADVNGWFFKGAFSAGASARVCLGDLGCAGGEAVFSSVGFAACVQTPVADFGAGYKWGDGLDIMFTGCDVGPYRAVAAAAQAGGARGVTFAKGLPSGVVAVEGQGGPPHVSLVGPDGTRIDAPATGALRTAGAIAFHVPETNTTYFVVKAPAAGRWTIEPAADSTPIAGVKSADGLAAPQVTTHLARAADGRRALTYKINGVPGQKVTFAEQGKGAAQTIGVAKGTAGTLRFTPADGPGGTRKIIAMVSSYGQPRARLTVGSYVAPPPPKPATPKRLKAARSTSALKVTWATAKNARRYELRATLSDGRRILVRQKARRFTIRSVASATRATITVAGLKADGTRGKKATIKVQAKKKAKAKKKK